MPVIVAPRYARKFSGFMFSAQVVALMADSGLEGVEGATAGAELFAEGTPGPLVLDLEAPR